MLKITYVFREKKIRCYFNIVLQILNYRPGGSLTFLQPTLDSLILIGMIVHMTKLPVNWCVYEMCSNSHIALVQSKMIDNPYTDVTPTRGHNNQSSCHSFHIAANFTMPL